jgi:hypothetical protein
MLDDRCQALVPALDLWWIIAPFEQEIAPLSNAIRAPL